MRKSLKITNIEIISETTFVWDSYSSDGKAKILEFITQPEQCLQFLQRAIQNMLLYSDESRTYCLQGLYDCELDAAQLKCSLDQLHCLASRNPNVTAVSSLVYAVFVVSHNQKLGDRQYTHYWLLRYNLIEGELECWDSYSTFGAFVPHSFFLKKFMDSVFCTKESHII